jgi:DNA primase
MKSKKARGKVVARYEYRNVDGELVFTVSRCEPKDFTVRSACGGHYPRVLYRLPELLAADRSATVFLVEGEKDVDRLWKEGLIATCNPFGGGKGKWTQGLSVYLKGRSVVILPDNDSTGREHAADVAKQLVRTCATVRVLELHDLPKKGDVSDWFDAGGTAAELLALSGSISVWTPIASELAHREFVMEDVWDVRFAANRRQDIYNDPALTATEKLLLLLLAEETKERLTESTIARCLNLTPRRVRQLIAKLNIKRKRGRPRKPIATVAERWTQRGQKFR